MKPGVAVRSISLAGSVDSDWHQDTSVFTPNLISGRTDSGSSRLVMVKLI